LKQRGCIMNDYRYVYGPVPSRRLGISLGISPIPKKTCNYSCVYCQLGRTNPLTNNRVEFFPLGDIVAEFEKALGNKVEFDVVTIVGEGEPTLYLKLGKLITEIKERTDKPVVVITNGALLFNDEVQDELSQADIVLPSIDAFDETSFKKINRPHGSLDFRKVLEGFEVFSKKFKGQLWLEIMLMKDINDSNESIGKFKEIIRNIRYDRLYINTPVRPPAEKFVSTISSARMKYAASVLGGISMELLVSEGFHSEINDDLSAILSIIKRHPMNQFEVSWFLKSRECENEQKIFSEMEADSKVEKIEYKGIATYRLI